MKHSWPEKLEVTKVTPASDLLTNPHHSYSSSSSSSSSCSSSSFSPTCWRLRRGTSRTADSVFVAVSVTSVFFLQLHRFIMATQFSVDPNMPNTVILTVIFMEDGWVANVEDFEAHMRVYVGGDILSLEREDMEQQEQLAVVLGVGGTEAEAEEQARIYVRRLCKWHGQPENQMLVFGHDLTQSQLFNDQDSDLNE